MDKLAMNVVYWAGLLALLAFSETSSEEAVKTSTDSRDRFGGALTNADLALGHQGLHDDRFMNWNSLYDKRRLALRKRNLHGSAGGFEGDADLGGHDHLQNWGSTFDRGYRAAIGARMGRQSRLGEADETYLGDDDSLQDWRQFFSRNERAARR